MKDERNGVEIHRRHPIRNFFYFLYTLLNALAFGALFYALEKGDTVLAVGAGAIVTVAVLVGVVDTVLPKRK